ncbi:glycosyltransferase family 2 protein [Salinimicrobium oceani]|uniref:Glycosyltransferase family 2 protein n=1 Tax=Salinimicrobium oceani TaxID=2722702 RepID=A0ABX1D379_9FLAO|nr:glycosyltransferase family 2 protein [Salinimicrobium oceani]NJW53653.1 glycosyltransferase family 2 protein [Salinimicrobium oceani]
MLIKRDETFVSVIIPNYNHSYFLEQRIESILHQTFQDFELILLDDCSTDNSREILSKYATHPKVSQVVLNEKNSGSTFAQWDKGISLATGDFIWIAESDDSCELNFLEKLVDVHLKHPEVALVYCQSHRINSSGEITGNWITHTLQFGNFFTEDFIMDGNKFIESYLIHKNVIPNVSGVLFKRDDLLKITPLIFEPYMKYYADWFYYIQLLCNSKIGFISDSLNYFRHHDKSVIGMAEKKSGWLEIFKMELRGREKMLHYLQKCKPSNLDTIRQQSEIGSRQLRYLTAKGFIQRGETIRGFLLVRKYPFLLKRLSRFYKEKLFN